MVAATKKGRPQTDKRYCAQIGLQDKSTRAGMNMLYALECVQLNKDEFKLFFVDQYGNIKKQGIAEQIGRIKEMNIASEEELIELTRTCIEEYNNGSSVKEIENRLRTLRKNLKEQI